MIVNSKQIIQKGKICWVFFLGYVFLLFLFMESMNINRILQFGSNLIVPGSLWRCKEHFPPKKSMNSNLECFCYKRRKNILEKTPNKSWVNNSMMEHNILKSLQPLYYQPFAKQIIRITHILIPSSFSIPSQAQCFLHLLS